MQSVKVCFLYRHVLVCSLRNLILTEKTDIKRTFIFFNYCLVKKREEEDHQRLHFTLYIY